MVDHRDISVGPAYFERQHGVQWLSMGKPVPAIVAGALYQSRAVCGIRESQLGGSKPARNCRTRQHIRPANTQCRSPVRKRTRTGTETNFIEQRAWLEHFRELHLRKESDRAGTLGIWICLRSKPSARPEGRVQGLLFLP